MSAVPTAPAPLASPFHDAAQQRLAVTLGMWVFLATELLLFGPLFFGYLYVRGTFGAVSGLASRHTDFLLGTLNTAILLTSSLLMALAGTARAAGGRRRAALLLLATAACGIAFLVIKGVEYHREYAEHLFPGVGFGPADARTATQWQGIELFFILYFAMTGLHALHLTIGVVACVVLAVLLWHDKRGAADSNAVEVAALYWHFVDVIWIFLYPLLYLVQRAGGGA
jgi:cytochrome c oxidase subunit 3